MSHLSVQVELSEAIFTVQVTLGSFAQEHYENLFKEEDIYLLQGTACST